MSCPLQQRGLVLLAAGLAAFTLGCLSRSQPEKERHVLALQRPVQVGAPGEPLPPGEDVLKVRRLRVSPLFERKGFVYRTGDTTFEDDFYREFYSAPGVVMVEATIRWFQASPAFASTVRDADSERPDWILRGDVQELYVDLRGQREAVIAAEFVLLDARERSRDVALRESYTARVPVSGKSGEAIADAWSRGLSSILTELEHDIHSLVTR